MADPVNVLKTMGGSSRWKTLMRVGVSQSTLRNAVKSGAVVRYGFGIYGLPGLPKLRIAMHQADGVPACLSAAEELGWWVLHQPKIPHIAVDHGRQVPYFIKHRARLPLSALDVIVQVLDCAPELDALVVLCSAIRKNKSLSRKLLAAFVAAGPTTPEKCSLDLIHTPSLRLKSSPDFTAKIPDSLSAHRSF
ncbi:type IV toxin-antitoxin system AbiEi family antitoxin domain-containing protein [Renibacterium salmoninarum]|nr:type IV toxin-antitoxin system AbiEi family antitoxin domain-containing protein [Renibacterium salmoninarum]